VLTTETVTFVALNTPLISKQRSVTEVVALFGGAGGSAAAGFGTTPAAAAVRTEHCHVDDGITIGSFNPSRGLSTRATTLAFPSGLPDFRGGLQLVTFASAY
jgi:hypothetical protein